MFCPNCGSEYEEDSVFCESCGMNLVAEGPGETAELERLSTEGGATAEEPSPEVGYPAEPAVTIPMAPVQSAYQPDPAPVVGFVPAAVPEPGTGPAPEEKKSRVPLIVVGVAVLLLVGAIAAVALTTGSSGSSDGQGANAPEATEDQQATDPEESEDAAEPAEEAEEGKGESVEHLVVFETSGGTAYEQAKALDGSVITTPTDPSRPGYVFEGWYADKDFVTPFVFPHTVEATDPETICIFAKWAEESAQPTGSRENLSEAYAGGYGQTMPSYYEVYRDCVFPQSSDEYLTYAQVNLLSQYDVQRAINEIYARNGYIFQSSADERAFFETQNWYSGTDTDMDVISSRFNDYERENIKLLQDYRASM
ncbi:MAG: YARHG domain-containing protein [Adlercreutzia sp.]|nr:YARHG domain-containing protein [Adlercreutzia sp.]